MKRLPKVCLLLCVLVLTLSLFACGDIGGGGKPPRETYTVTFDEKGGSDVEDVTVKEGGEIAEPSSTKNGYALDGWYYGDRKWNFDTDEVDGDITLTAKWVAIEYDIDYDLRGGSFDVEVAHTYTVKSDSMRLPTPTMIGYTFLGWTTEGQTVPKPDMMLVKGSMGDKRYTAHWALTEYTITYDNIGSAVHKNPTQYTVASDTVMITPPEQAGYTFLGWTYEGQSEPVMTYVIEAGSTGSITLKANWTLHQYSIDLDLDGGAVVGGYPDHFTAASDDIVIPDPTRAGYTFLGWVGKDTEAPVLDLVIPKGSIGDVSYTATWEMQEYELAYDLNGGTCSESLADRYTVESDSITLPTLSNFGYTFLGWTWEGQDEPMLTVVIEAGSTGDRHFKAHWTPTKYAITYVGLGNATHTNPTHYTIESDTLTIQAPSRVGYTFLGWTYEGQSEPVMTYVIEAGSTVPVTLTANWLLNTYSFEINANGGALVGTYPDSYTVESGDIVVENPTRDGYTFLGWVIEGSTTPILDLVIKKGSVGDVSYTASWELVVYKIEYDLDGGTFSDFDLDSFTVESGTITLPSPSRPGYAFLGWTTDGVDAPTENLQIVGGSLGDKSFTAHWGIIEYKVEISLGDGTYDGEIPTSYTVESGNITLPTPKKLGYTFLGWTWEDQDEPKLTVVIETGSTGDRLFKANWAPIPYLITYENLGNATHRNPETYTVESLVTLTAPVREGYTFLGWTYEGQSIPTMTAVIEVGSTGAKHFRAVWSSDEYSITLDLNGGVAGGEYPDHYTAESDDIVILAPTKEGYTFAGWICEGSTTPILELIIRKGSFGDVSYTASWKAQEYTIEYILGGGAFTVTVPSVYTAEDDDITLAVPVRLGYTFLGWTYEGQSEPTVTVVIPHGSRGERSFTAHWSLDTYSFEIDANGGTLVGTYPDSYTVESDDIAVENPTREGYTFLGWIIEGSTTPVRDLVIKKGSVGDVSYTASWKAQEYTIEYILGGGAFTVTVPSVYTAEDDDITLAVPVRLGYTFLGWTYEGQNEPTVTVVIPHGSSGERSFTAHWSMDTYSIELDANGGTLVGTYPDSYTVESDDIAVENPTREGYTFLGWVIEGSTTPVRDLVIKKGSAGDVFYTASWKATEYKIEYDLDGGTFDDGFDLKSFTVESGTITLPSPSRPGYAFLGWTTDGVDAPTENLQIAGGSLGDKSFTAHWSIIEYKVEISLGDGSYDGEIPTTYTVESGTITLPIPKKHGYTFLGWTWEGQDEPVRNAVIEAGSTGDRHFKANWELTRYTITYANIGNATHQNPAYYTMLSDTITITAPERLGFTFLGWTYEGVSEPTMTVVIEAGSTGDIVLTANWYSVLFNVTYQNTKGAYNPNANTYISGVTTELLAMSLSGYTFLGWYDADGQRVTAISENLTGDIVLTAKWSSNASGTAGITYTPNADGTSYTVTGYTGSATAIVIPSTYNGLPVVAIGDNAFKNKSSIKSVIISDGIISIGQYAFSGCSALTSITIGADVKVIGKYAFQSCTKVTAINFYAVACDALSSSSNYAFYNVGRSGTGITVTVGADVTRIPGYIFYPTSSASYAPKITSLVFEDGSVCESIGDRAFYYGSLKELKLPDSVTSIGWQTFYNNSALASVSLPAGLETIGSYAFYNCTSLTSITIGENVTSIGEYAFAGCKGLTSIYYNAVRCADLSMYNNVFNNAGSTSGSICLTIGNKVEYIPKHMFYPSSSYHPYITSVIFEKGSVCEEIGDYAFAYLYKLTSIELPASVKTIGQYAFYGCSALTTMDLGGTETIGKHAFYGCSKLEMLILPATVKTIGENAFSSCNALKEVHTPGIDAWCSIEFKNQTANPVAQGATLYVNGEELTELVIPEDVKSIGSYAFYGATIEHLSLPASVKTIGDYAFAQCTSLVEISMPGVTAVGKYAFSGCSALTELTLPSAQTLGDSAFYRATELSKVSLPAAVQIGTGAFQQCEKLEQVLFGEALESIGNSAFSFCSSLAEITLPTSLKTVGNGAFSSCSALTAVHTTDLDAWCRIQFADSTANPVYMADKLYLDGKLITDIVISGDVESIGSFAFVGNTALKSVTIAEGVKSISNNAFAACTSLTNVTLPDSLEMLNPQVFFNCPALTGIIIPDSVPFIGDNTFYNCQSLAYVTIGKGVTQIANDAFKDCFSLREVVIPDTVTSIGSYAFDGCRSMTKLTIGAGVRTIGMYAFRYCSALTEIQYNAKQASNLSSSTYAFLYAGTKGDGITVTFGKDVVSIPSYLFHSTSNNSDVAKITSIVFEDGAAPQSIGQYAFYHAIHLTSLTIPEGVTSIGAYAFYYSRSLPTLTLPDSLTSIGNYAFYGSYALESLTVGDSLRTIGEYAFAYCQTLTSIRLPATLTSIGNYAFDACEKLQTVTLSEGLSTLGSYAFRNCKELCTINLPSTLTSIGAYAFQNCKKLSGITLPEGLKYIYDRAFSGCASLESITIPDTVTYMGSYVFENGTSLTTVTYGSGMTSIPTGTFMGCSALKHITIPESVTSIGQYAFQGCSSLLTVEIPESITSIGSNVFQGCAALSAITIPESVTSIGQYAFQGCTGLAELVIPDSVWSIGTYAFEGCTGLTSLTIGKGVTSLGNYAFANATALEQIYFGAASLSNLSNSNYVFACAGTLSDGVTFTIGKDITHVPAYLLCPAANNTYVYAMNVRAVVFEEGSACTSIGNYAFAYTTGLKELSFPAGVTLGTYVLNYCRDLETFKLTEGITSIPSYMFRGCAGLKSIEIPASVTSIGSGAFYQCTSLASMILGDAITSIGSEAFYQCSSLTSITIGENVTSIGSYAFDQCYGLTEINLNAKTLPNVSSTAYVFRDAGKNGAGITLNVGAAVTAIPNYMFYTGDANTAPKITRIVFAEDGVCSSIGQYAFAYNLYLLKLTLPESLTSIGNYAFRYCERLFEIENRSALTLYIGSSSNGYVAAYAKNVYTAESGESKFINIDGILYYKDDITSTYLAVGCDDGVTELIFAESIDGHSYEIAPNAFRGRAGIMKVVFSAGITKIGEYAFYGCSGMESLVIPAQITEIGAYTFYGCSGLTELVIPDTVTTVGQYAFYGCSGLETLVIGKGVSSIGKYAFSGLTSLTELEIHATALPTSFGSGNYIFYEAGKSGDGITVTFGSEVTHVPAYIFCPYGSASAVPNIKEVIFEDGSVCTSIGAYAFYLSPVKRIALPDSVTTIDTYAFYKSDLEHITLPKSLTTIGSYAFSDCYYVKEIVINSVAIGDLANSNYVFYMAGAQGDGITVTVGKDVTRLPAYLFCPIQNTSSTPKITVVEFAEDAVITDIGAYAFYYNSHLISITVPDSLTTIGAYAFGGCTALSRVDVSSLDKWMSLSFATAGSNPAANGATLYVDGVALGNRLVIPEGVTSIGAYAFYNQTGLTELVLPDSVTSIGDGAFAFCGFTELVLNVESIGSSAFSSCASLTSLTIGEDVVSIGTYAFSGCRMLQTIRFNAKDCLVTDGVSTNIYASNVFASAGADTEEGVTVVFGKNVTRVPNHLFAVEYYSSPKFAAIVFEEGSACSEIGAYAFYQCSGMTSLTLPEHIKTVGTHAFYGCEGLTEIDLGGVTALGSYAFYACSVLERVTAHQLTAIGEYAFCAGFALESFTAEQLKTVGSYAFLNCTALKDIVLADTVTTIGSYAFQGCTALQSITIGKGVKTLGFKMLDGCTALTQIYFNAQACDDVFGYDYPLENCGSPDGIVFTVGKDVTRIPARLFYTSTSSGTMQTVAPVSRLVFEEGSVCKTIGAHAFYRIGTLTDIALPEGLTTIGEHAFYGCTALTEVILPDGLIKLAEYAFYGCTALTQVSIPETVESVGYGAFGNCPLLTYHVFGGVNYLGNEENPYLIACSVAEETQIAELVIHPNARVILPYVFNGNKTIRTLTVGDKLVCIGAYAFSGCSNLTSVTLGSSVRVIGSNAFYSCTSLEEIVIPDAVESIGSSAFAGCTAMTSITVGKGVTTMGDYAFSDCYALTELRFNAAQLQTASDARLFSGAGKKGSGVTLTVGKDVTVIPAYLFRSMSSNLINITSVTFEEGATCTTVGMYAFENCTALKSFAAPASLTTVEAYAFRGCTAHMSFEAQALTAVGEYAFEGCTALEAFAADALTTVGAYAFHGCTSLKSFVAGALVEIGYYAFDGCTSLVTVTLPTTLTTIGSGAFQNCSSLKSIEIPSSMTELPSGLFKGCSSLESLTLPFVGHSDDITQSIYYRHLGYLFGTSTYSGSTSVTVRSGNTYYYFYIPTSLKRVTVLGGALDGNFSGCTMLTEITLTGDIRSLASGTFTGCSNLATVNYNVASLTITGESTASPFAGISSETTVRIGKDVKHVPSMIFGNVTKELIFEEGCRLESIGSYAFAKSGITELILPDSVTSIGVGAFQNSSSLQTVYIPSGVSVLPDNVFYNAKSLTSVTMGNVTSIGANAFYGCALLADITIPATVTEIGESAFSGTAITSVVIPTGVRVIPDHAFNTCTSLARVTILGDITSIGERAFYSCSKLESINLGNTLASIGNEAFYGCKSLTAVTLPDTLQSIGQSAFSQSGLTSITIPDSVTTVGGTAFAYTPIKTAVIGSGVTVINAYLFSQCTSLESVTIPTSVTSIGNHAFYYCTALKSAPLPDGLITIGANAFSECSALLSVELPSGLTDIGSHAFYNCRSLTGTIVIPDGISSIEYNTFHGCSGITEVVIGNNVRSIMYQAFRGCTSLTKVTIGTGVDYIGSEAFTGCNALSSAIFLDPSSNATGVEWHAGGTTYHFYISPSSFADTALMARYLRSDKAGTDWSKTHT